MSKHIIINVGRQLGSGGRIIGDRLAKDFGIKFYDKELLDLAAKESGFDKRFFERNDEHSRRTVAARCYLVDFDEHFFTLNNVDMLFLQIFRRRSNAARFENFRQLLRIHLLIRKFFAGITIFDNFSKIHNKTSFNILFSFDGKRKKNQKRKTF